MWPKIDWSLNVGYVLVVVAAVGAGLTTVAAGNAQVAALEARTFDYAKVRDLSISNDIRLDVLTSIVAAQVTTNEAIMRSLAAVREDLAAIRATLAARSGP